jgi:hypothetical protein
MIAMMRFFGALAIATTVVAASARAADLPQWVKGPISGLILGCQEDKQRAPAPSQYVTIGDVDGDGKPDYIVDIAKGCAANRLLYCNDEGCNIGLYVSSQSMQMGSFKVKSFAIGKKDGKPVVNITKGGKACATMPGGVCYETLAYTGESFVVFK